MTSPGRLVRPLANCRQQNFVDSVVVSVEEIHFTYVSRVLRASRVFPILTTLSSRTQYRTILTILCVTRLLKQLFLLSTYSRYVEWLLKGIHLILQFNVAKRHRNYRSQFSLYYPSFRLKGMNFQNASLTSPSLCNVHRLSVCLFCHELIIECLRVWEQKWEDTALLIFLISRIYDTHFRSQDFAIPVAKIFGKWPPNRECRFKCYITNMEYFKSVYIIVYRAHISKDIRDTFTVVKLNKIMYLTIITSVCYINFTYILQYVTDVCTYFNCIKLFH